MPRTVDDGGRPVEVCYESLSFSTGSASVCAAYRTVYEQYDDLGSNFCRFQVILLDSAISREIIRV